MPTSELFETVLSLGNPDAPNAPLSIVAYLNRVDINSQNQQTDTTTLQPDAWSRKAPVADLSLRIEAQGRTIHGQKTLLQASLTGKAHPVSLKFQDNSRLTGTFWITQFQDTITTETRPSPFRLRLVNEGAVVWG